MCLPFPLPAAATAENRLMIGVSSVPHPRCRDSRNRDRDNCMTSILRYGTRPWEASHRTFHVKSNIPWNETVRWPFEDTHLTLLVTLSAALLEDFIFCCLRQRPNPLKVAQLGVKFLHEIKRLLVLKNDYTPKSLVQCRDHKARHCWPSPTINVVYVYNNIHNKLRHWVQTGTWLHSAPCPVDTGDSFPRE